MAGAASAQNSVTVGGIVDAGINSIKLGSKSALKISEGGLAASQLAVRGTEDLGGGFKAIFDLNMGISIDTGDGNIPSVAGSTGVAFTRNAWMGLDSNGGSLKMGRQYTPQFLTLLRSDVFGLNGIMGSGNLWFSTVAADQPGLQAQQVRQNNSIQYATPTGFPVIFSLMYGAGEAETPSKSSGRLIDWSLGYASGPFWAAVSRQERKSGSAAAPAASPDTSVNQLIAATYQIGAFRLGGNIGNQKTDRAGTASTKLAGINGVYQTAGAWKFMAAYQKRDVSGTTNDQNAYTVGFDYDLSKRTSLYGRMLTFKNSGTSNLQLGGYTFTAGSAAAGEDGRSIMFGVAHRF